MHYLSYIYLSKFENSADLVIGLFSEMFSSWVKVNPGTYGFYRVRYSSDLLSALLPAVRNQTLHPRDRLALQSDIFALVRMV